MSTDITMQELETETAELLPSRETLNCWRSHPSSSGGHNVNQFGQGNVVGNGNYDQHGFGNIQADNNNVVLLGGGIL
jgi:hypothetical protein